MLQVTEDKLNEHNEASAAMNLVLSDDAIAAPLASPTTPAVWTLSSVRFEVAASGFGFRNATVGLVPRRKSPRQGTRCSRASAVLESSPWPVSSLSAWGEARLDPRHALDLRCAACPLELMETRLAA